MTSWRLYYMTFAGLGIHQKSLKNNSSCFEVTKRIRSWSKSNSVQQTKFAGHLKNPVNTVVAGESVSFNKFRKKLKKQLKFSQGSVTLIKDGKLWRSKS